MKNDTSGWAQLWSCGGTLSGFLLPLTTTYSLWWWVVILTFATGVASAIWFIVWPWLRRTRNLVTQYRVRSPIERKLGWPHVVPLAGRIHHMRSYVDFRSLESERTFQVTLKLLNSSIYNLQIQSVSGHTQHDGMGGSQPIDIAWKAGSNRVGPLSEFEVAFDQRVPSEAALLMAGIFSEGKYLSVYLEHIHVMVRAIETSERAEAKLWDGISCVVSPHPVAFGVIVTATANIGVGWSGSRIEP